MQTETLSLAEEIIQDAQDYTLFSWSKQKGTNPIAVKRAEGVYLYDYDDNRIIDFSSGLINSVKHPIRRAKKQIHNANVAKKNG